MPIVEYAWAVEHRLDYVVAIAIHVVASRRRKPEQIAAAPTKAERNRIAAVVSQLVACGRAPRQPKGMYNWGDDPIIIEMPERIDQALPN